MADQSTMSSEDVVKFLKDQHEQIKKLFADTLDAGEKEKREESFLELRRLLAVHETAEEMVVHPAARREVDNGEAIVDARLSEEHEAKENLTKIENMDVMSDEFVSALKDLRKAVVDHAEHEESEEFSKLGDKLDESALKRMTGAVRAAEAMAPTRPHPGVESAKMNFAAGPFAAMLDRARDAVKQATT